MNILLIPYWITIPCDVLSLTLKSPFICLGIWFKLLINHHIKKIIKPNKMIKEYNFQLISKRNSDENIKRTNHWISNDLIIRNKKINERAENVELKKDQLHLLIDLM